MNKIAFLLAVLLGLTSCSTVDVATRSTGRLEQGGSICSGVYIRPDIFLTAEHCIKAPAPSTVTIAGKDLKVLDVVYDKTDHALIRVDKPSKYFSLISRFVPKTTDHVFYVGNAAGFDQLYREGYIVGIVDGDALLDVRGWKGDSGAGVFNKSGFVVGTMNYMIAPLAEGNLFYLMGMRPWTFEEVDLNKIGINCRMVPVCSK